MSYLRDRLLKMDGLVDRLGFLAITASITYGANQIKSMGESIATLNTSVAVVITQGKNQNKEIDDLKGRVLYLERLVIEKRR